MHHGGDVPRGVGDAPRGVGDAPQWGGGDAPQWATRRSGRRTAVGDAPQWATRRGWATRRRGWATHRVGGGDAPRVGDAPRRPYMAMWGWHGGVAPLRPYIPTTHLLQ